jgi:hypothetical protein
VTWQNTGTDANPHWIQTTSLTPTGAATNAQIQQGDLSNANLSNQLLANSAGLLGNPVSTSGLPSVTSTVNGGNIDQARQQAQDAVYKSQTAMLDPQYQQQQEQLQSQLAAQGIVQGSDAYNNAMNNFTRQRDAAYAQARNASVTAGNDQANAQFGQGLSAAQLQNSASGQALNQLFSLRGNTLNEIQALRTGAQVNAPNANPSQGIEAAPTNIAGIQQNATNNNIANANAQTATDNANTQAGVSALASLAMILLA